jgi:hypothetical protein
MNFSRGLHALGKKAYQSVPPKIRVLMNPTLQVYAQFRRLRPEVWRVSGREPKSGLPISICLYVATEECRSYLLRVFFGSSYHAEFLGRVWLWNICKQISKGANGCSMAVAEMVQEHLRFIDATGGFVIPAWVTGELELPLASRVIRHKSLQSDLRNIRQNCLEFEITRDPQRFEDFYQNMYVPHARNTFGEGALLSSKISVKNRFDTGDMLLVKKGNEYISGMLISYEAGSAKLRCLGVRDGKREHVSDGAIAAAYEFAIRHLEAKGHRKVCLGRSRAFLGDGVLRYKKKWSQRITGGSPHKFVLQVLSHTEASRSLLENTPFVFEQHDRLSGLVFVGSETPLTAQSLADLYKQHSQIGVSPLIIVSLPENAAANSAETDKEDLAPWRTSTLTVSGKRVRCERLSPADTLDLSRQFGPGARAFAIYPESEMTYQDTRPITRAAALFPCLTKARHDEGEPAEGAF